MKIIKLFLVLISVISGILANEFGNMTETSRITAGLKNMLNYRDNFGVENVSTAVSSRFLKGAIGFSVVCSVSLILFVWITIT